MQKQPPQPAPALGISASPTITWARGGPKAKFQANITAIKLLKYLEETTGQATPGQQEILSRYVGWGGVPMPLTRRNLRGLRSMLS